MRQAVKTIGLAAAIAASTIAGASAQTNGVTPTEVTFGSHTDLSGVAATYGISSTNGAKMRIEEANAAGGINGRKIKFIIEDAGYQVPKAVQACNKLIHRDKVFAFLVALGTPMNNACFKDQLAANIPSLFPITAARSMFEPFDRLKFYASASYVDQVRAGINYLVTKQNKKAVCVMYQDTDFGKEVLEGAKEQTEKLKIKIVETATHKPTDQDFTAARKSGWDVTFLGSSATYDVVVGAAPGMDGFYGMGLVEMPYADSANPDMKKFVADYKAKYNIDPNVGAVYGYIAADLTAKGLQNAGKDLTVDSFVKGMEAIKDSHDKLGGPPVTFGPKIRQGANSSFLAEVKGGKWTKISEPLGF